MLTRRKVEAVLSFCAVTAAKSSLVPPTGSSVTSEVTPESSPSIVPSLSKVRLHLRFESLQSLFTIQSNRFWFFFFFLTELTKKLFEFCGYSVDLRCQLPNGDLETLISVKSDEELANIVELYNRVSGSKIKAVLSPPRSQKSPSSSSGGGGDRSPNSPFSVTPSPPNSPPLAYGRYQQPRYCLPPTDLARRFHQRSGESYCYACRVHKGSRLIWHWRILEYTIQRRKLK